MITSYPHWYLAEPDEVDKIEGLVPEKSQHETTIDVERVGFYTKEREKVSVWSNEIPC